MEPRYVLVISHFSLLLKCFEKNPFYKLKLKVTLFSNEPVIGAKGMYHICAKRMCGYQVMQ